MNHGLISLKKSNTKPWEEVKVTPGIGMKYDEQNNDGYNNFSGLEPGNYVVFVWSVDNWGPGEPLEGFQSTNGFVSNANNDIDFDNNGYGNPFTDIMSGIVTLTSDEEPLNDGDPYNCYFDYDASGNNSVDFGFFNPNMIQENPVCQVLNIPSSWSTFSSYMLTENMQLNDVLTPINDKVIIVKNSSGNAYLPDWDYNGIGDMQVGQGYYIKTNQSTSLEICGEYQLPEENSIELNAGWNIIGYLRLDPANIADVFGEITDNDNLEKEFQIQ
mgnify:CR=1 FL=1